MSDCPTPEKRVYPTRRLAKQAAKRVRRGKHGRSGKGRLHAYLCRCGGFHVGTLPEWVLHGPETREALQ